MTSSLDHVLRDQLSRLEARGRRHLLRRARRAALDLALAWALPAAIVVPALWLLAHAWLTVGWPWMALGAVLLPALTAIAAYALACSRQRVDRDQALGLFDQQLGLKDRLTASAALLAAPRRDGFAQAALMEAAPWVEQALSRPLSDHAPVWPDALRRRWLWLPAALLLAVAAAWMQGRAVGAGASGESNAPGAASVAAQDLARAASATGEAVPSSPLMRAASADRREKADPRGAEARGGPQDRRPTPTSIAAAGGAGTELAPADQPGAQPGAAKPGQAADAMMAGAQRGAQPPVQRQDASRQASRETEREQAPSGQRAEPATAGAGEDATDDAGATAAQSRPQGQQEAPSQRGAQPPAAAMSSKTSKDGQSQESRGKNGNDSQNDGKGGGEGQNNGQRKGEEAGAKSGRGFATLMLARPMRDQVRGQTSAGPVASALQAGRPQGGPAATAQAQDRGALPQDAAVLPAAPRSAQDRALLRDYFARPGADGAAPATDNSKATR